MAEVKGLGLPRRCSLEGPRCPLGAGLQKDDEQDCREDYVDTELSKRLTDRELKRRRVKSGEIEEVGKAVSRAADNQRKRKRQ